MNSKRSTLSTRTITAIAWVPVNLGALWLGDWVFALWVAILAIWATSEILNMLFKVGRPPLPRIGAIIVFAFLVGAEAFPGTAYFFLPGPILLLSMVLMLTSYRQTTVFERWGLTTAASFYTSFLIGYMIVLRQSHNGLQWMGAAMIGTWFFDTGAYLVGRLRGRRLLFPAISPGKTWEGTLGGVLATMAGALSMVYFLKLSYPLALGLGLTIAVLAQLGDLVESLIKRQAGVKDSGSLLPGHGGILDRIDGLMFSTVGVYYFHLIAGH